MKDDDKIEMMTSEYINNVGGLVVEVTNNKITPLEFVKELEKNRGSYWDGVEKIRKTGDKRK